MWENEHLTKAPTPWSQFPWDTLMSQTLAFENDADFLHFLTHFYHCKMSDSSPRRLWLETQVLSLEKVNNSPGLWGRVSKLSCLTRVALLGLEVWALGAFTILENSFSLKVFPCVMLFVLLRNATCPSRVERLSTRHFLSASLKCSS